MQLSAQVPEQCSIWPGNADFAVLQRKALAVNPGTCGLSLPSHKSLPATKSGVRNCWNCQESGDTARDVQLSATD